MRRFFLINLILLFSLALGACAPATPATVRETVVVENTKEVMVTQQVVVTATAAPAATTAPKAKYSESPMLASLVEAGKIPPLEQRLPADPMVVTPAKEVGQFGGDLRFGFVGNSPEWGGLLYLSGWEHPLIWNHDFNSVMANWATVTANDTATVWTMAIRKGLKWSDGQPFTADDIAFYIQDVVMNKELSPNGWANDWLPAAQVDGFQFKKVDDQTIQLTFPKPYGTFPYVMAQWQGRTFSMYPKHYLQQFHKTYNPNVDELVKKESVDSWVALFYKKGPDTWGNPGRWFTETNLPSLYPYVIKQPLGSGTQVKLERNPFYWKVDTEGNQLPYIDTITATTYQDEQGLTLAMLNGDIDALLNPGSAENKALYVDAIAGGKPLYLVQNKDDAANGMILDFNQTTMDPIKAEVFADKNFRIGVSYALNRQELIDLFNDGRGRPSQVCPQPSSPLYNEAMCNQYIEFDLAKSKEYLDKAFPKGKDSAGFYLDKTGKRFSFVLLAAHWDWAPRSAEVGEVLAGYMKKAGLDVKVNAITKEQFDQESNKNNIEASLSTGEGGSGITAILDPRNFVPMNLFGFYGNAWSLWYVKPAGFTNAVEPPQWVKDARAKYDDVISSPTPEQQIQKMKLVIQEAADRFYTIGGYQGADAWTVFNTRVGNVYQSVYFGWNEGDLKIYFPEQWYLKQ